MRRRRATLATWRVKARTSFVRRILLRREIVSFLLERTKECLLCALLCWLQIHFDTLSTQEESPTVWGFLGMSKLFLFPIETRNNNTSPYWAVQYNEQSGLHITTQIRSFTPFCVQSRPVKVYLKPQFSVLASQMIKVSSISPCSELSCAVTDSKILSGKFLLSRYNSFQAFDVK